MVKLKRKGNSAGLHILFSILLISGCKNPSIKNYFFSKDFEGNVAVIYGNSIQEKQEVYNFNIPQNGILRTPYTFHEGDYQINFYQKNEHNGYDTLSEELPLTKIDTTKNRIYFNRVLTFEKEGSKIYTVSTFYVGKKKASDLVKDRFFFERELEEIVLGKKK